MKMDMKIIIPVGLVIFLGIFLQTSFILIESVDTPQKIAIKFCKAFYKMQTCADKYVTKDGKMVDDVDLLEKYRYEMSKIAKEQGYRDSYAKKYLFNIKTHTISQSHEEAKIKLTCNKAAIIPWLRTRRLYNVDNVFTLVKENHKCKISGGIESLN